MDASERFANLVRQLAGSADVKGPHSSRRGFGSDTLKVNGSIFAMVSGGRLVVKLPSQRVSELIATGAGSPFDGGKGRPMREWLTVTSDNDQTWLDLAKEALGFVRLRTTRAHP